jgi:DNA-directed RNA polymerase subunit M/transcription elongation factor TFIIS
MEWKTENELVVFPENACPACGENRMGYLEEREDQAEGKYIHCKSCGASWFED